MPTSKHTRSPSSLSTPTNGAVEKATAPIVPMVVGSADAVLIHRAAAERLPPAEVLPFRADADLAFYNAMRGRDALVAARAAVDASGFHADWSLIDSLDSIGLAMTYVASRVEAQPRESNEVLDLLREGRPLRRVLLSYARTLSLLDRCPAREVARIAKGTGARDTAHDLADLAALFTAHGLAGTGDLIRPEQVRRAAELGTELGKKIRPAAAARPSRRTPDQLRVMDLRNRLWTLFVRAYAHVELAAGAVWGRHVAQHVPPLQARIVVRKAAAELAPPTA